MAMGAVVKLESGPNVALPPPSGMLAPAQLPGVLQLPPVVPTSAAHVPLVCAAPRVAGRMMPTTADVAIRNAWRLWRSGKRISLPFLIGEYTTVAGNVSAICLGEKKNGPVMVRAAAVIERSFTYSMTV